MIVEEAIEKLKKLDESVNDFYNDPMTDSCGCTDDFAKVFSNKEKNLLAFIIKNTEKDSNEWKMAMDQMDKFLP